jgi:hypothetical protein
MTIETPNGYKVFLKEESDLTYRDRRSIQKVFLSNTKVSAKTKAFDVSASTILDAQDELLRIMLLKILTPSGEELSGDLFEVVSNWKSIEDADSVYNQVNEVFSALNESKKK